MFSRTFLTVSYRSCVKSNFSSHMITTHRSIHHACRHFKRDLLVRTCRVRQPILTAAFVRHASDAADGTTNSTQDAAAANLEKVESEELSSLENLVSQIPEPPTPIPQNLMETITSGEPAFTELGLGGWTPAGLIQHLLEYMHVTHGIPWWGTIVCTTICFRMLLLPVVIKIQRYSAKMHNVQPQIQYLQEQLAEARKMGDHYEVARISSELYSYMKEKGINPLTNAGLPLLQAPVFLSFFWALRGMVRVPVESMKDGGLFWFQDLTIPDPYYALPLITSVTLFTTIELGTDNMRIQSLGNMRHFMRALPIVLFPFIINFEGAILCYWVSTNVFSLIQVSILRLPNVRDYCKIPPIIQHDKKKLPLTKKKFVEGFRDSWSNMKIAREINAREMYDEQVFMRAGKGPVPKTYKFDPTKTTHTPPNAVFSKKRE